jgi:NAD-dependent deacetylase
MEGQPEIDWKSYSKIVVLTGAGISVASGLRPYRGPGGLWEEQDVGEIADRAALERDPGRVWAFFAAARREVGAAEPNAAHEALARLEARLGPDRSFVILTQNIDRLHQRAGSQRVVELHGSLHRSRCTSASCGYARDEDLAGGVVDQVCPACPECGAPLRPDVVLFNEPLPVDAEREAKRSLRDCELFLAIGTSGSVSPASNYVRSAEYEGARTILVNLEPMRPRNPAFQEEVLGRAEVIVPGLVGSALALRPEGPKGEEPG